MIVNYNRAIIIYIILIFLILPLYVVRANKVVKDVVVVKDNEFFEENIYLTDNFTYNFKWSMELHFDKPKLVKILPELPYSYNFFNLNKGDVTYGHYIEMFFNGIKIYAEDYKTYDELDFWGSLFPRDKEGQVLYLDVESDNVVSVEGRFSLNVTTIDNSSYLRVKLGPITVEETLYEMVPYLGLSFYDYFLFVYVFFVAFLIEYIFTKFRGKVRFFKSFDGISFKVGRGEIFGLIGPNGAGKRLI